MYSHSIDSSQIREHFEWYSKKGYQKDGGKNIWRVFIKIGAYTIGCMRYHMRYLSIWRLESFELFSNGAREREWVKERVRETKREVNAQRLCSLHWSSQNLLPKPETIYVNSITLRCCKLYVWVYLYSTYIVYTYFLGAHASAYELLLMSLTFC